MKSRLILAANAIPRRGGQGLNLQHMITGLGQGFDLTLFCRAAADGATAEIVPESRLGKLVNRTPILRRRRDWQTIISDLQFDRYVAKRLKSGQVFQGVVGQCSESLRAAAHAGIATALDVVNTHVDDLASHVARECARFNVHSFIHPRMQQRILLEYQQANLIRVMSEYARSTFITRGFATEKIVVAAPPIDLDLFTPARFEQPKFRISFVGLIEPWKGFHYLIEAFNRLNLKDSELILWGGAGARGITQYLQIAVANNPRITINPVEVRQIGYGKVYGQSSVLVHPSLSDGFGYVVAEAMASGIPVIVSSNVGAADLVRDGENGYVIAPADIDALRDRLAHLATRPALVREMGAAARATVSRLTYDEFRRHYLPRLQALG